MDLTEKNKDLIRLHRWLSLRPIPHEASMAARNLGVNTPINTQWDLRVYANDEPFFWGSTLTHIAMGKVAIPEEGTFFLFNFLGRFETKKEALLFARDIARWAEDDGHPFESVWIEPHWEEAKWKKKSHLLIKPTKRGNTAPLHKEQ